MADEQSCQNSVYVELKPDVEQAIINNYAGALRISEEF